MDDSYPKTKPEGAYEITAPLTTLSIDLRTGVAHLTFGPGEEIDLPLTEVPGAPLNMLLFLDGVASFLNESRKVWADPAIIERDLGEAKIQAIKDRAEANGGVPF